MLKVDNDKAQQKGVSIEAAMDNLSILIGSTYETSFIKYDRQYKVMVQALPQYRSVPEDILKLYTKNEEGDMVPYGAFMSIEKVYGLSEITRHNGNAYWNFRKKCRVDCRICRPAARFWFVC